MLRLNSPAKLILLFKALVIFSQKLTITQLNTLDSFRLAVEDSLTINLNEFISGQNITFAISGIFNITNGVQPTIKQRLVPIQWIEKTFTVPQQAQYGSLALDPRYSIIYSLEGSTIIAWDYSNIAEVFETNTYTIQSQVNILCIDIIEHFNDVYIATAEKVVGNTKYMMRMVNATDIKNITQIGNAFSYTYKELADSINFYYVGNFMWIFMVNSDVVNIYQFDLDFKIAPSFSRSISQANLNQPSVNFTGLATFNNLAYLCDYNKGIFIFDLLAYLIKNSSTIQVTNIFIHPLQYGNIISCVSQNNYLTVTTSSGPIVYYLPDLSSPQTYFIFQHPNEASSLFSSVGVVSNQIFTMGYFISQIVNKANSYTTTFRVYSRSQYQNSSVLLDEWTWNLYGDDLNNNPYPAFSVIYQNDNYYLIANPGSSLRIFQVMENPTLLFDPGLIIPYTYKATLNASNDEYSQYPIAFNFAVQAILSENLNIFPWRGKYKNQGFIALQNISEYLTNPIDGSAYIYIPISNYAIGHNVSYQLELSGKNDNPQNYNTTISIPPKIQIAYEYGILGDNNCLDPFVLWFPFSSSISFVITICNGVLHTWISDATSFISMNINIEPKEGFTQQIAAIHQAQNNMELHIFIESTQYANNETNVLWEAYNITVYEEPYLIFSIEFSDSIPSSKLQIINDLLFSLRGNEIQVFKIEISSNNTFELIQYNPINQDTIEGNISFMPVDFAIDPLSGTMLYVYDFFEGLICFTIDNVTTQNYSPTMNGIYQGIFFTDVEMIATNEFLYIFSKSVNPVIIQISTANLLKYRKFPSFGCVPSDFDASYHYLAVMCSSIDNVQVLIYDVHAENYCSLYTTLPSKIVGSIAVTSEDQFNISYLYYFNGDFFTEYYLGQVSDDNWLPYFPIDYFPNGSNVITEWGRFGIQFEEYNFSSAFTETLQLTTIGSNSNATNKITVQFCNIGNFLDQNEKYRYLENNLTNYQGIVDVTNSNYAGSLPLNAFIGNDIDFGYILSNDQEQLIFSSDTCDPNSQNIFCIESKTRDIGAIYNDTEVYDFIITSDMQLISIPNMLVEIQLVTLLEQQMYNLSELNHGKTVACDILCEIPNNSFLFAAGCNLIDGANNTLFVLSLLNLNDFYNSYTISIPYKTSMLESSSDNDGNLKLYHYCGTVLTIFNITSSSNNTFSLSQYATITSQSLSINTFNPINIGFINNTYLLIGDSQNGIIRLVNTPNSTQGNYKIFDIYMPSDNILNTISSELCSMILLANKKSIITIMSNADVYLISLTNSYKIKNHFPPMYSLASTPSGFRTHLTPKSTFISFPVIRTEGIILLRIFNYSETALSAIYKDISLPNSPNYTPNFGGRLQLYSDFNGYLWLYHNLMAYSQEITPLSVYEIRQNPQGYIYHTNSTSINSMKFQLMGLNIYGLESWNSVEARLKIAQKKRDKTKKGDGPDSTRSSWNTWWFWSIIFTFSTFLIGGITYLCVYFRAQNEIDLTRKESKTFYIGMSLAIPNQQ
ncbi:unnamed protein product [Blepharisma stoltei]|uniref:Transmembrane protein n=1 Tax=Blepharisma stoltei TaxID=1481888 RepID=A0AAU9K3Q5_9CILI|nr:unnamed protein product [Blepharisma stoltei]